MSSIKKKKSRKMSSFNMHNSPVAIHEQIRQAVINNLTYQPKKHLDARGQYDFIRIKFPKHLIIDDVNEHHKLSYLEKRRKSNLIKFFCYFAYRILFSKFEYIVLTILFISLIMGNYTF